MRSAAPAAAQLPAAPPDDYSAVAYFYLDRPENGLPRLAPVAERVAGLDGK